MSHLANRVALHMQLSQFKAQNNLKNVFFTVKNYNHGLINNKIDIIVGGRLLSSMLYFNKRPDNDFIEHIKQLVALFDTENYYVLMSILSFTYETTPQGSSSELRYEFFIFLLGAYNGSYVCR